MRDTIADKSTLAVIASGLFGAMAGGTSASLWAYMQSYFWSFDTAQISGLLTAQLVSALIGFYIVDHVTRGRDKKPVLITLSLIALVVSTGPVFLRVVGLFFPNDHDWLFPVMLINGMIEVTLAVMTGTLFSSMIADITEHRAVETARREEGLLYSAQSFIGKVAGGVGVWTGGIMLAVISFPTATGTADVPAAITHNLGWIYAPTLGVFYALSVWALSFFDVDRKTHAQNVAELSGATS